MSPAEKEIVDLMKEWKEEVKKISTDYNTAISALSDAKTAFDKKSWWDKNQHWLAPIILVAGMSVIALGAFKISGGDIKIGDYIQITQPKTADVE